MSTAHYEDNAMTIERFKQAKNIANTVRRSASEALGTDSPDNDKHTWRCVFVGLRNSAFSPMQFQIDALYGYYGSSSGYSATSVELGKYIARAITQQATSLLEAAVRYAEADAEKARLSAELEAREVLTDLALKGP